MTSFDEHQLVEYQSHQIELRELLGMTPVYYEQLKGRAQFYLDQGQAARALIMLEMLEELDRTDPQPTLAAVDILLADGNSQAAEDKLQRLLAQCPDLPVALVSLAELRIRIGDLASAVPLLRRVLAADPEALTPAAVRARSLWDAFCNMSAIAVSHMAP